MHPSAEVPNQQAVAMLLCQRPASSARDAGGGAGADNGQPRGKRPGRGAGARVTARYTNRRVRFLRLSSPRPAARIGIALATREGADDRARAALTTVARGMMREG